MTTERPTGSIIAHLNIGVDYRQRPQMLHSFRGAGDSAVPNPFRTLPGRRVFSRITRPRLLRRSIPRADQGPTASSAAPPCFCTAKGGRPGPQAPSFSGRRTSPAVVWRGPPTLRGARCKALSCAPVRTVPPVSLTSGEVLLPVAHRAKPRSFRSPAPAALLSCALAIALHDAISYNPIEHIRVSWPRWNARAGCDYVS